MSSLLYLNDKVRVKSLLKSSTAQGYRSTCLIICFKIIAVSRKDKNQIMRLILIAEVRVRRKLRSDTRGSRKFFLVNEGGEDPNSIITGHHWPASETP